MVAKREKVIWPKEVEIPEGRVAVILVNLKYLAIPQQMGTMIKMHESEP